MNKIVNCLKIIALIGLIVYIFLINYQSFRSRIEYSDKLYAIEVFKDKVLVKSIVVDKYPEIKNNSITLPNGKFKPITYKNCKIIVTEIKELD